VAYFRIVAAYFLCADCVVDGERGAVESQAWDTLFSSVSVEVSVRGWEVVGEECELRFKQIKLKKFECLKGVLKLYRGVIQV
jgi:hypothetical protein